LRYSYTGHLAKTGLALMHRDVAASAADQLNAETRDALGTYFVVEADG